MSIESQIAVKDSLVRIQSIDFDAIKGLKNLRKNKPLLLTGDKVDTCYLQVRLISDVAKREKKIDRLESES